MTIKWVEFLQCLEQSTAHIKHSMDIWYLLSLFFLSLDIRVLKNVSTPFAFYDSDSDLTSNHQLRFWYQLMILVPIPTCRVFHHIYKQLILGLQLRVLLFNSVLTLSTWREQQIPQVKGSVPQDCPHTPNFRCQSEVQAHFWLTSYRLKIPTTPSLDSINLLEGSQNSRETLYL